MNKVYILYDRYSLRGDLTQGVYASRDAAMAALEDDHSKLTEGSTSTKCKGPPGQIFIDTWKGPPGNTWGADELFHAHFDTGLFDDARKQVLVKEYKLEDVQ